MSLIFRNNDPKKHSVSCIFATRAFHLLLIYIRQQARIDTPKLTAARLSK